MSNEQLNPADFETIVIVDEIEVIRALFERGLSWDVVRDSILAGEGLRNNCTANYPIGAPGYFSYAGTTAGLADRLLPRQWERRDLLNVATVISPNGDLAVTVCTGDENTGSPSRKVKTKYKKGLGTVRLVDSNRRQMSLFDRQDPAVSVDDTDREAWLLLRHRSKERLYSELSKPLGADDEGRIAYWHTRIILPVLDITPGPGFDDSRTEDDSVDFDIDISRRA